MVNRSRATRIVENQNTDSKPIRVLNIVSKLWYVWLLILVPGILQLLYSRYGFAPTDDGFVMAYSRRILSGQLPHIDFISIRPAGSAILHSVFVLIGGDFTLYLSRLFVWFEFSFIAASSLIIAERFLRIKLNLIVKVCLALISIFISAHFFPLMAWYTTDGIFMILLGSTVTLAGSQRSKYVGYFLIGFSYLCKQNFLLAALVAPFIFSDWKNWRIWLAVFLPGFFYLLPALFTGDYIDYTSQLFTQSNIQLTGVIAYKYSYPFLQSIVVGSLMSALFYLPPFKFRKRKYYLALCAGSLLLFWTLKDYLPQLSSLKYLTIGSFALAGIFTGNLIVASVSGLFPWKFVKFNLYIGLIVWSASISIGYNNPTLGCGLLISMLLIQIIYLWQHTLTDRTTFQAFTILSALSTLLLLTFTFYYFDSGRKMLIYEDLPQNRLKSSLAGRLYGGRGILTNSSTAAYYDDLNATISSLAGKTYAILPENAAYWIKASQQNPLPIDWPNNFEVNAKTEARLEKSVDNLLKENGVVILEKYYAAGFSTGLYPMQPSDGQASVQYPIWSFVKNNYHRVSESNYFEVYGK